MTKANTKIDLNQIKALYEDGLDKHGMTSEAVGWNDEQSHNFRFGKLLEVVEDKTKPFTVNELGCGYGAMFHYLIKNGFNVDKFYGYDISPKFLEAAKQSIHDERAEFIQSKRITKSCDYSFESGIFNVKFDMDNDDWKAYIEETLHNINECSLLGFGFNLMTSYVDFKKPILYYADPKYFFDFCKKNFSKKVTLLHDYDLYEWTIIVKK